jgi:hypothetical protein
MRIFASSGWDMEENSEMTQLECSLPEGWTKSFDVLTLTSTNEPAITRLVGSLPTSTVPWPMGFAGLEMSTKPTAPFSLSV